jgi:hypothetical protein
MYKERIAGLEDQVYEYAAGAQPQLQGEDVQGGSGIEISS